MSKLHLWGCLLLVLLGGTACVRSYPQDGTPPPLAVSTPKEGVPADVPSAAATSQGTPLSPQGLPTPAPQIPPASRPVPYAVVLVDRDSALNLRSAPSLSAPALALLPYDARNLVPTGNRREADGQTWVEIESEYGNGWVSAAFLSRQVSEDVVCGDSRVQALVDAFVQAVQQGDGAALASLVSPVHGLTVRHEWWNPPQTFSVSQVRTLFEDQTSYDWGIQDGSGMPLQGSFAEIILPRLQEVATAEFVTVCNSLENGLATGGTAGLVTWPYPNMPFIALYRPAPADSELDWRTWALGIVWDNGRPYLAALIQYHWEV
ncbi:MAG: hypothetical protein D6755_04105 [Anaerolineae bacterium]|nr:MAG: hypothetical protein D6755_04105 [Anaerolineae bacterium]